MIGKNFFSDLENKAQAREKLKNEIDELLANEDTTLGDILSMENQEKQDEILAQLSVAQKNVMKL